MIALLAFLLGAGLASLLSAWAYTPLIKYWRREAERRLITFNALPTAMVQGMFYDRPFAVRIDQLIESWMRRQHPLGHPVESWASLEALIGERTAEES